MNIVTLRAYLLTSLIQSIYRLYHLLWYRKAIGNDAQLLQVRLADKQNGQLAHNV